MFSRQGPPHAGVQIPAWPFVTASFAAGVFALLPYFALWDAPKEKLELPPKKEDLVRSLQSSL